MSSPIAELVRVSKTYVVGVPVTALRDVNLAVLPSGVLVIMGPSGSGKSTLLGLLGLLDAASSGTVRAGGVDTTGLSEAERSVLRRDMVGFVFQQFNLMHHLTAQQNVEAALLFRGLTRRRRRARAAEILAHFGLGDRLQHRPSQLSGGEQQRVALARAIAGEPAVVLADEPTGNLDIANTET
ncbi:MAG: ABC transporter ATP-binding protein, partial [bacterium]